MSGIGLGKFPLKFLQCAGAGWWLLAGLVPPPTLDGTRCQAHHLAMSLMSINIFWALLRAHFNPHLMARAKMSLSRAQNIFMPSNINSIVLLKEIVTYM